MALTGKWPWWQEKSLSWKGCFYDSESARELIIFIHSLITCIKNKFNKNKFVEVTIEELNLVCDFITFVKSKCMFYCQPTTSLIHRLQIIYHVSNQWNCRNLLFICWPKYTFLFLESLFCLKKVIKQEYYFPMMSLLITYISRREAFKKNKKSMEFSILTVLRK